MRRRGGIAVALDPASMKRRALLTLGAGAAAFVLAGHRPSLLSPLTRTKAGRAGLV